jgi:hypothetical protein
MRQLKNAFIVGNGAYAGNDVLRSPPSDARRVAKELEALGFRIVLGIDLDAKSWVELLDQFIGQIDTMESNTILFYFSGHGCQVDGSNFLVPIDYHLRGTVRLIALQDVVDRISQVSEIQIIILDACRGNTDINRELRGKSIRLGLGKVIHVGDAKEPISGLAEMRASANAFIAFAAAPGDVAFEGEHGELSQFTRAFVRHMSAADLPLSNLMSRVRQEVFASTYGRQKTWDHSSLMGPFYFNRSTAFPVMGNALALLGFVVSLIPYSFLLTSPEKSWGWIALATLFVVLSMLVLFIGMYKVYARLRGDSRGRAQPREALKDHTIACLIQGGIGGYLGSLIASLGISFVYYWSWVKAFNEWGKAVLSGLPGAAVGPPVPLGKLVLEIVAATVVAGCLLGFMSLFFTRVQISLTKIRMRSLPTMPQVLVWASIGGGISGLLCGPMLMLHFGNEPRPELQPEALLPGAILGATALVFSIVNFDYEQLNARRFFLSIAAALSAVAIGSVAALALFGSLHFFGAVEWVIEWLSAEGSTAVDMALGGMLFGGTVGLVLGAVIGLAITLTSYWSKASVFGLDPLRY